MSDRTIPIGISDFSEIRQKNQYYIDKTGLICSLLKKTPVKVTLITRPRRFGKTLAMSMLAHFFDVREDSSALFHGLAIEQETELCAQWQNRYPTIFLTFKDVDGLNFESASGMLRMQLSSLFIEHNYLLKSEKIDENEKALFLLVADAANKNPSESLLKTSISLLMRMMAVYYGKPVILLIDEYDVPLAKASTHGYYQEMLEVMRAMMSTCLKDNRNLSFAVVTGCLRIAKESIFTGTNNFVSDTISRTRLNEYFGFTQAEVDRLLEDFDQRKEAEKIKAWYDGYHFGDFDIYCPWDVLNYLYDLQNGSGIRKPVSYWKNTSDNAVIRTFIDHKRNTITNKMETLMNGGYILQRIEDNMTFDFDRCSDDNFWSVLYLTGYLTRCRDTELADKDKQLLEEEDLTALKIPNEEIREIYKDTIVKWFQETAPSLRPEKLYEAVWAGDDQTATAEMTRLLKRTISFYDYGESFYHAFLAGIFIGAGYAVESNREHGMGRSDVVVSDSDHDRIAVFEVNMVREKEKLEPACTAALDQIREREYAEAYSEQYSEVRCYGIAFYKKECLIKIGH